VRLSIRTVHPQVSGKAGDASIANVAPVEEAGAVEANETGERVSENEAAHK
jgi:hypothetical protein